MSKKYRSKTLSLQVNMLPLLFILALNFIIGSYKADYKPSKVLINEKTANTEHESEFTRKVLSLESFFDKYKSPLKNHAKTFVQVADKYGIDYKLLPAISCMESSCGKNLISESFNPFGWGIYGNNAIYFNNYDEAIETVGKGISEHYIAKGFDSVDEIAPIYTPPNHVNWKNGVSYFIAKID